MKYRKKPVVIEATQWFKNGDHPEDECYWVDDKSPDRFLSEGKIVRYWRRPDTRGSSPCSKCGKDMHIHGWIDTLEDGHRVCPNDWIITGVQGELYPCKPDIFEATYELVGVSHYLCEDSDIGEARLYISHGLECSCCDILQKQKNMETLVLPLLNELEGLRKNA